MTKKVVFALYAIIVACIGVATVVERYHGTDFVGEHIYGAWWFVTLWAMLTVAALAYMMKQQLYKRFAVMLLHVSFVVILAGALVTHFTARRDTIHLRTAQTYSLSSDTRITLKEFSIVYYPGTDAPLDYQSVIQKGDEEVVVSMNHPADVDGYRLFQQSYDSDGEGIVLGVSYDPFGIAITYAGYLMLLIGIIATLLSRKTQMRALYKKAFLLYLFAFLPLSASAEDRLPAVDAEIAHRMGTIHVLYNDRICPLNTVATDFTMKMTGSASWNGYSADEVFFSWMIFYMPWEKELLTSPKDEGSENSKDQKKAAERRAIVEMFYNGQFLKIFPAPLSSGNEVPSGAVGGAYIKWFSPGGQVLPREIPVKEQFFIKQSMDFLTEAIVTGQRDRAFEIIAKIKLFQHEMAGDVLPSNAKTKAEIFYNTLRSQKWPVFLALTLSLLLCVAMLFTRKRIIRFSLIAFHLSLLAYVTLQLALRWWLSGHIPVSNGPETMLFMAWVMLLLTILLRFHSSNPFHSLSAFGPLIASFCLLVAMLGGNSAITPLMPVLQSPLLSIHVITVMCAYALFALQLLLGIHALILIKKSNHKSQTSTLKSQTSNLNSQITQATALSQFLLYPAVFLLTIGIFLGAVWANVSWGCYWSWDPKESWALITLMVYAVPLHKASVGLFRRPCFYHLYMVVAFLAVLITYFGVNYLLGGMHSYA